MSTTFASRCAIWTRWVPALALLFGLARPADGQYFGRNKVVYRDFDFRVLQTPHYDVHFYPEEATAVRDAARMAERWYARLARVFGDSLDRRSLILYASPAHFHQTNVVPGQLGEGTGGVTEGYRSRVTMPLTGLYDETDHVLGHELVHVFQYAAAEHPEVGGVQRMANLPLWLVEGMAEYLSLGRVDRQTAMWMRAAVLRNKVPGYRDLFDPSIFPYRYGQAISAYIGGRWGDERLIALYRAALQAPLETAIGTTLGLSADSLVAEWEAAMRAHYGPVMHGRADPASVGRPVLAERQEEPGLDVGPVVSPDGRSVAFFSSRSLFAIDLYIADAATGTISTRLTSPTGSSHFDALSFLYTAGTWSPDSRQFAFVTYKDGRNAIAIVDVGSGDIVRQITTPAVDAIASPTWSPDGNRIAFSGQAGGITDLYVHDLGANRTERLTSDAYADLQPAWSPDGRLIAFVTDRGSDLSTLKSAPLRVATLAIDGRRIEMIDTFRTDVLNPQWSPDSRSLYVLAAPDGFQDIYRVELATGRTFRVTQVATGVSGVAALSPAISVAASTGAIVFSVFDRTGYRMRSLDAGAAQGEPVASDASGQPAAGSILPPTSGLTSSMVETLIHDPMPATLRSDSYAVAPYSARLRLDAVSPVTVGVASSAFGTGVAGGVGATWSDELGNRQVGVAVQSFGDIQDIGAEVAYLDLGSRWQKGVSIGHIPYLTSYSTVGETDVLVDGSPVTVPVVNQYLQRIYFDQAQAGVAYPLSTVQRLELGLGATRVSFRTQVRQVAFVGEQGFDLGVSDVPSESSLMFGRANAALVFDNSIFGFTSPITGGRYRLEAAPALGDITFTTVTLDYRRYLFARPFTLAVRGISSGRYGPDAESERFAPLYIGDGSLVRGYSVYSFDPSDCTAVSNGSSNCPEFDRLIGSRIAAASLEFRIPLFGTRQFGLLNFPWLPTEVAPFVDAGVAWTSSSSPKFVFDRTSTDRIPIVSAGISSRMNLFGAFVVEVFYAKPFQRPAKSWIWGFQLLPGW
jgi:Tol biopolymer transport system component